MNGAIEELEKQGKVLVTRTEGTRERDGQMKAVFLDEVGKIEPVDQGEFFSPFSSLLSFAKEFNKNLIIVFVEFKDLWTSLKTPLSADDLSDELKTGSSPPPPLSRRTEFMNSGINHCVCCVTCTN